MTKPCDASGIALGDQPQPMTAMAVQVVFAVYIGLL